MTAAHGVAIVAGVVLLCGGIFWGAAVMARDMGWIEVAKIAAFIVGLALFLGVTTALISWGFGS